MYLSGMKPEDDLRVVLAPEYTGLHIGELLEAVFPEDEDAQSYVEEMLDVRENPDLPDIYDVLLDAFEEWRSGRCVLKLGTKAGSEVEPTDEVLRHLIPPCSGGHSDHPALHLTMRQEYPALDHIVQREYWADRAELVEWLQSLTLLYFLDKHEFKLPAAPASETDRRLMPVAEVLQRKQLIATCEDAEHFEITPHGRDLIGNQIAETESYIDRFDVFKDVDYDVDTGSVQFGNGRGEDLRVQVFIAEGLDPVRAVFLLRLYDGTLDEFVSSWPRLIHETTFYDGILEPVMDHERVDDRLIGSTIESGYAHVEERDEDARETRSRREILERVRGRA